jgi:hypothetical protein
MSPSVFRTAPTHTTMTDDIPRFIARWQAPGAAERANYQLFLSELCDVLDAPRPDPTTPDELAQQAAAVRAALAELGRPATAEEVAGAFDAAPVALVSEWLAALAALGQARVGDDGTYVTA